MRRSEICALKWSDIDYKTKTLSIKRAKVINDENKWVMKTTKTFESTRKIHLPDSVINAFTEYKNDNEYIVTILPGQITIYFQEIIKKCGIEKNIRFHDLRHYNASVMHMLNIPDKYAMRRGGWSTDYTMKNVYQHTFDKEFEVAESTINNHFDIMMHHDLHHSKDESIDK